jgi:hypothetical protein
MLFEIALITFTKAIVVALFGVVIAMLARRRNPPPR